MKITASDLRRLKARQSALATPKSGCWPHWGLFFAPGTVKNPLNQRWIHWGRARWTEQWHDKVAGALFEGGYRRDWWPADRPKQAHFKAHVTRKFDYDGLVAAMKPALDALVKNGVLHSDAPDAGHTFTYEQLVNRAWQGVEIRVVVL